MAPSPLVLADLPVKALVAAPWNANVVDPATMKKIEHSIRTFGVVENLVVRPVPGSPDPPEKYEVLSGNHRLRILRRLKMSVVQCHVVDLDDADARLLAQTLNRTRGDDDPEKLEELIEFVRRSRSDADLAALLRGFDESTGAELDRLAARGNPDDVPDRPKRPASKLGEVYELGPHRLLCGDCTDAALVAKLAAGELADCVWTDPPYGVNYTGGRATSRKPIAGDTPEQLDVLLHSAFQLAPVAESRPWYVASPDGPLRSIFVAAIDGVGWRFHQTLVWVKNSLVLGHLDYQSQHENVLYGFTAGAEDVLELAGYLPDHESVMYGWTAGDGRPGRGRRKGTRWFGNNAQTSVLAVPRPSRSKEHPTMKPVELVERCIRNSTDVGQLVYDPFGGSGSTLVAAEKAGRRCLTVEIDPGYCDVIRQRYATYVNDESLAPRARRR